MKRQYSIFEAKAKLSEIIRTVRQNEEVVITDRSEPVVRVIPYERGRKNTLIQRYQELQKQGFVRASKHGPRSVPQQTPKREGLLRKFLEERD
jgi:prevent-host-death family protein